MTLPKFEQSSWEGIIGADFTTDHVAKVCRVIALWMKSKGKTTALLGHDTRFGGLMFANVAARNLEAEGIQTISSREYITSPILILNMVKRNVDIGLMITGSSKAAEYSGIKIKGISSQEEIQEINKMIAESFFRPLPTANQDNDLKYENFEESYLKYFKSTIDINKINQSGIFVAFDAMYGATQSVYDKILPNSIKLRCEINPSFKKETPHPTPENLKFLKALTETTEYARCGFASNSDGELLAMCDEKGSFIDPYKILAGDENIPWRDGLIVAFKVIEKMIESDKQLSEFS